MVNLLTKELDDSFSLIISYIKSHPKYQEYLLLSKQIENHDKIILIINQVKKIQKELVKLEYYKKDISETDEKYKKLLSKLDDYPLYQSYINAQKEVNSMLQYVKLQVETLLFEITNS